MYKSAEIEKVVRKHFELTISHWDNNEVKRLLIGDWGCVDDLLWAEFGDSDEIGKWVNQLLSIINSVEPAIHPLQYNKQHWWNVLNGFFGGHADVF